MLFHAASLYPSCWYREWQYESSARRLNVRSAPQNATTDAALTLTTPNRTMSLLSEKIRVSTSSRSLPPQKHFAIAWYNGGSDFETTTCRMHFQKKKRFSNLEILHGKTGLMAYHPRHSVGREDGEQGQQRITKSYLQICQRISTSALCLVTG